MEPARKALRVGPLAAAVPMATHHAMLVVSCTELRSSEVLQPAVQVAGWNRCQSGRLADRRLLLAVFC